MADMDICTQAQAQVLDAIPPKWKIKKDDFQNVDSSRNVPAACGVLSSAQLSITEMTSTQLLEKLHTGQISAMEVTESFCARAAIAHQMVNCLTDFFPQDALEVARELDATFEKTQKPIGPLHGLPIAIKDMSGPFGSTSTTSAC